MKPQPNKIVTPVNIFFLLMLCMSAQQQGVLHAGYGSAFTRYLNN